MAQDANVIVIGGGVAGLACARRLLSARRSVVVIEARLGWGGRIDTQRWPGWPGPIERGAEFVHGEPAALLQALDRAGARRVAIPDRHWLATGGRLRSAKNDWRRAESVLAHLPGRDVPFATVAARARRAVAARGRNVARLTRGFVEGFNAADAHRASARWLREQQAAADDATGLHRVRGGYDQLVIWLARRLGRPGARLLLGAVVTSVEWGGDEVVVRVRGRLGHRLPPLRAKAAVVTLPLGVLRAGVGAEGAVQFRPALPTAKRAAIRALKMGSVVKVLLRFRPRVDRQPAIPGWPAPPAFVHAPDALIPTWWRSLPLPPNVVVGWVAGPAAELTGRGRASGTTSVAATLSAAVDGLGRMLGTRAAELHDQLEDAAWVDWHVDPYTRGAYSWLPAGAGGAPRELAAAVGGRLFFAGEATASPADLGTVNGALDSGRRAAEEILGTR